MILARRDFFRRSAAAATAAAAGVAGLATAKEPAQPNMTLGFSTYGMKSLKTEKALQAIAKIGFDSVELCLNPGWDAEPSRLTSARRKSLRGLLEQRRLGLRALMEHLPLSDNPSEHAERLKRLERAAELGHTLSPQRPPLVETILGGGKWEQVKTMFRDQLGDWAEVADKTRTVIAIKPHRGGAMSRPQQAVWLIEQLGRPPRLRLAYDYSHYAFRDMSLSETVETALPYTAFVAVKDPVRNGGVRFVLPGEAGTVDYVRLLKLLHAGGYCGDVNCEVSGMVWHKPGYEPLAAAETCYANMARAFREAGVDRPSRKS